MSGLGGLINPGGVGIDPLQIAINQLPQNLNLLNFNNALGNNLYHPIDLLDSHKHAFIFMIEPYLELIEPSAHGIENTIFNRRDLTPIYLQLPIDGIQESYTHEYEATNLLFNPRELMKYKDTKRGGDGLGTVPSAAVQGVGNLVVGGINKLPGADTVTNIVNAAFRGGSRASIENIYKSPNLRTWNMKWKFLIERPEEEDMLTTILKYIKICSAPDYTLIFQKYPALFDLKFCTYRTDTITNTSDDLNIIFTFTECMLTEFNFNPNPTGRFALTKGGFPVESELSLTFVESRFLDANAIAKEWNSSENDVGGGAKPEL